MTQIIGKYFHYVELADGIYAAIAPREELDITDAGLMNNFSNSGLILKGGGMVCDTCFDLPHAKELLEFCDQNLGHAPGYVFNTHGHWDHYWGNQVFDQARILGQADILKDCHNDKMKVPVFKLLHNSVKVEGVLSSIMEKQFRDFIPSEKDFHLVVRQKEKDFDLKGVVPTPPKELFTDKKVIQLGETTVELIPLGAIHSSSDTVAWLPEERILFAGDIFADCSMPTTISTAKQWIGVMDFLINDLKPKWIVPGHGEVYDINRAKDQRSYFSAIINQLEMNYTDSITEKELLRKIDLDSYINHRPRTGWVMAIKNMFKEKRKNPA